VLGVVESRVLLALIVSFCFHKKIKVN